MDRLKRAGARNIVPRLIEGREVADALAGLSARADLTVMATRRRTRFSRLFLGSVSRSLLRGASKPLFVVPGYDHPVDLTARPLLDRALAPLDGSPGSEEVLPLLATLGKAANGVQTLLRVVPEERPFTLLKKSPKALIDLKEVVKRWKAVMPKLQTSLVWSDARVKREVLYQAAEQKVDFIAVATRGLSPARIFRPGLAEYLLRHATIPLLVVKQRSVWS
jgi:nucleotide-binding universal stress UspA family protein